MYRDFETRHRQALWKVINALYILSEQRDRDLELAQLYKQLKQRRSRSRTLWKKVLRFILQGRTDGYCDLDLFLVPFFMPSPSPVDMRPWYPGSGDPQKNIPNLISALTSLDSSEPWRNQFRSRVENHPGSSIARLSGKFFSEVVHSDPDSSFS